jgi:uncharacterized membrane protein YtjA (UPF0391 family)
MTNEQKIIRVKVGLLELAKPLGTAPRSPSGRGDPVDGPWAAQRLRRELLPCWWGVGLMLYWALTFLVIAIVAAVLGFGGIAGTAMEIARLIFFVAIVLFAISAIVALVRGRSPPVP